MAIAGESLMAGLEVRNGQSRPSILMKNLWQSFCLSDTVLACSWRS